MLPIQKPAINPFHPILKIDAMKKHTVLVLIIWCILTVSVSGQQQKIQADRPGETLTPEITEKSFFISEIGFDKKEQNKEDHSYYHPQAVFRFGLSKQLELRAELTVETQKHYRGSMAMKETN